MGFAKTPLNPPNQFLKKSNHGTPKNAIEAPPFKYKVLNCQQTIGHTFKYKTFYSDRTKTASSNS